MIILDGKKVRDEKLKDLKNQIKDIKMTLAVIQIGNDEASNIYINEKRKMCDYLNINFKHILLDEKINTLEVEKVIEELNNSKDITGILLQLPIPKHLDEKMLLNKINVYKDIDGLSDKSVANFYYNKDGIIPCTPKGIITLMDYYNITVAGKNVVIIGRSSLEAKPLFHLLLNKDATVTMCHSKTNNLKKITKQADIIITAVGKKNILTKDMVKKGVIVFDCGITRDNNKVIGDVDYQKVKSKTSYITPVPGGIGPMTILSLAENIYIAYLKQNS